MKTVQFHVIIQLILVKITTSPPQAGAGGGLAASRSDYHTLLSSCGTSTQLLSDSLTYFGKKKRWQGK